MKTLFLTFGVLLLTSTIYAADVQLNKRDVTCESILSVKVCTQLRDTATTLKLKASSIETAIKDAYNKGITKADEIKTSVDKFLQESVLNKNCEDILGQQVCDKFESAIKYLNKKGEDIKPYIVKAIADGASLATDVSNKVTDYIRTDLMTKTCVDFFSKDRCQHIDDIGNALKLKADQIKQATIAGILDGYNKVEDTVTSAFNTMKKYAENFTCEELLNPDICKDLRSYAQKLKIGMPKLMGVVRSAIVMGYKAGTGLLKAIYKIADAFYDCEDFISKTNCDKIKETADKIGASLVKVSEALKTAVAKGISETQKIYESAKKYLTGMFGRKRRSIEANKDLSDIIKKYEYILREDLKNADEFFKKHIEKTLMALGDSNLKITELIRKILINGDMSDLKNAIKEIIGQKGEKGMQKRGVLSIRENLQKALGHVTGIAKRWVKYVLQLPSGILLKYARQITEWLNKIVKTTGQQADMIENTLHDEVQSILDDVVSQTDAAVEGVLKHHVEKRSTSAAGQAYLRKVVFDMVKKYTNDAFEKLTLSSPDITTELINLLKRSGGKVVNIHQLALEVLKKYVD